MVNAFKNLSSRLFFRNFEKRKKKKKKKKKKLKKCTQFVMDAVLRKSLVLLIKKTGINKTLMASKCNFNGHFGIFWSNFIKINSVLLSSVYFNFIARKAWFEFFLAT